MITVVKLFLLLLFSISVVFVIALVGVVIVLVVIVVVVILVVLVIVVVLGVVVIVVVAVVVVVLVVVIVYDVSSFAVLNNRLFFPMFLLLFDKQSTGSNLQSALHYSLSYKWISGYQMVKRMPELHGK